MWRTIGASVIGASHAVTQTRCQDHCAYACVPDAYGDALVIAVADGAGSAPASFHGAKTAVDAAIAHVVTSLDERGTAADTAVIASAFASARARVLETADEYGHYARDYASTLLLVLATAETTLAGQIGDGAIIVDDGLLRALTWPQQGEYANATSFLVDDDALERLVLAQAGPASRIAVLSDGLQNLALQYQTREPYGPFFTPFFDYLAAATKSDAEVEQELREYLDSAVVNERTDDDKTLVLSVRP